MGWATDKTVFNNLSDAEGAGGLNTIPERGGPSGKGLFGDNFDPNPRVTGGGFRNNENNHNTNRDEDEDGSAWNGQYTNSDAGTDNRTNTSTLGAGSFAFVPSLSFFEQYLSGFLATQSGGRWVW